VTLRAADVSELFLETTEAGGSAAAVVVVGGSIEDATGRRMALTMPMRTSVPVTHGSLGNPALDEAVAALMREALSDARTRDGLRQIELDGETVEIYLEMRWPVQELIVVGAGHVAQPMAHVGALLGFKVTVIDDRPDFATRERFPDADRLIRADFSDPFAEVPLHARSHILLVTRGHKYDYECLIRALRADPAPAYIGMIGSRRRVRATYVQLIEEGFDRTLIDRIHAPVGLDIGSETPEEIAVSVAAELVMLRRGGTGVPLKDRERVAERFFTESRGEGQ
jgi:xanthine dehydrogenase accessory factor